MKKINIIEFSNHSRSPFVVCCLEGTYDEAERFVDQVREDFEQFRNEFNDLFSRTVKRQKLNNTKYEYMIQDKQYLDDYEEIYNKLYEKYHYFVDFDHCLNFERASFQAYSRFVVKP